MNLFLAFDERELIDALRDLSKADHLTPTERAICVAARRLIMDLLAEQEYEDAKE